MRTRKRLYPEEAEQLGLEVRPPNSDRTNARYMLTDTQLEMLKKIRSYQKINRLFFDIETSPNIGYFWRSGYKQQIGYDNIIQERRIICISYKWELDNKVHHLVWDKNQCDKQMLIDFVEVANKADELVAHNGDRFDIKWIRTRCLFHRIPMFPKYRTLDTLKKARGSFYFNSNRLDYIAKYLGVGQKMKHEGFSMWVDVMNGDKDALDRMVEYCDVDVVILEDVYHAMQRYIINNTHTGVLTGGYKHECPNCGNEHSVLLKNNVTRTGTIKRLMECDSCEYVFELSNRSYMDTL
jgi:uncharacterized protein YprB with RNaseH-like and TPR domain